MTDSMALARPLASGELDSLRATATELAASGIFPDVDDAAKALAIMLIGRDMGLGIAQALVGIRLVKGKPMFAYPLLGALIRRAGYEYRIVHLDENYATVAFYDKPHQSKRAKLGDFSFSMADAKKAGLLKQDSGWEKNPRNMLVARALSNGQRIYIPDAVMMPVYVEGEIVDDDQPAERLTDGDGDGSPLGIDLGEDVERVLERAKRAGHVGLADRATAEMALAGQPGDVRADWVATANGILDSYEARHPYEASQVTIVGDLPGVGAEELPEAEIVGETEQRETETIDAVVEIERLYEQATAFEASAEELLGLEGGNPPSSVVDEAESLRVTAAGLREKAKQKEREAIQPASASERR